MDHKRSQVESLVPLLSACNFNLYISDTQSIMAWTIRSLLINFHRIDQWVLTDKHYIFKAKGYIAGKKIVNKRHFFIVIINHDITQTDASVILNCVEKVDTLQPCGCDWTPCRVNGTCCPVEVKLDNLVQVKRKYITGNKVSPKLLRFQLF